ncbi:regulator of G-protein signaling 9-binding protein isoform X1 [Gambusia affinis]|uniref:regulator of G-protein signaling 9-binding protein isoform X1 n=1 Tax=Gambusia affinis TaxID=33528 RepID=UPI001CDB924A|nr:regulator of G-protein signaling 9-binding protein isoform X1 [Gambusia affinis]
MSRWRRSVDELTAGRRRQQAECERAQNALSRVTSCFQQLVVSLGSSADSNFLREEMEETRALAHRICSGLSRRLLRLLSACDSAPVAVDDRHASERLWVLFLSAMEYFLSDLRRAKELIGQFPLTQRSSRHSLVNSVSCRIPPLEGRLEHPLLLPFPLRMYRRPGGSGGQGGAGPNPLAGSGGRAQSRSDQSHRRPGGPAG